MLNVSSLCVCVCVRACMCVYQLSIPKNIIAKLIWILSTALATVTFNITEGSPRLINMYTDCDAETGGECKQMRENN